MNLAQLGELLQLAPVQRAILALIIASTAMPVVGVLIVGLNIMAVRFAMMHVALLGIALGMWLGFEPTLFALLLCALAGAATAPLAGRPAGLSGPHGFLMTMAIAAALIVLSISGVNANGAFELLWGSILATRPIDVLILGGIALAVLSVFAACRRPLALLLFDRELAICSGVHTGPLTLLLLVLIAISVAASVRLTGALLVDSVTLLPALGARNLGKSLGGMVGWAIALGLAGNTLGFALCLILNQPPGPILVMTVGTLTLLTYLKDLPLKRLRTRAGGSKTN